MRLRALVLFAVLCLPSLPAFAYDPAPLTLVVNGKATHFTLAGLRKSLRMTTVAIDDPVYGRKKTYDGFPLLDVLALAGLHPDTQGDEVVFTAKDGYAPTTALADLRSHTAVLAFREHGTQKHFDNVMQGKALVNPARYYVVWTEGKALESKVPWPYQLVKIEVVSFAQAYGRIYPKDQDVGSAVKRGFLTFKNQCLRCHSLNLQGGDLGPELNVPKNVTEYWDKDTLRSFIHDASRFRARDKMPSFSQLSAAELDQVLEYLTYMKGHKQMP